MKARHTRKRLAVLQPFTVHGKRMKPVGSILYNPLAGQSPTRRGEMRGALGGEWMPHEVKTECVR